MKHIKPESRLHLLNSIPRYIVQMHGVDNISEFVLHNICCSDCFNIRKAAYFVDNPAFNCLKGVVGYDQDEAYHEPLQIWNNAQAFSQHMKASQFNQKVRNCHQYSCKNCDVPDENLLQNIASDLGMDTFNYCTWEMKHENHGYLIYQKNDDNHEQEELLNGLTLLSFCPIF